jgi:hypothetical protein
MNDSTLRVVVEIDDAPESPELREAIRDRIERRLSYGVSWYDAETNITHELNVDRVTLDRPKLDTFGLPAHEWDGDQLTLDDAVRTIVEGGES